MQSAVQLNTSFPFVRTFGSKIPVQMFANLISKLLCNTFTRVWISATKKVLLWNENIVFGSRETYMESLLKVLGGKIVF